MKTLTLVSCALLASVAGCATEDAASTSIQTASTTSAITTDDTDFAPECAGILGYVNQASQAELDSYLPSNVAAGIYGRRVSKPFVNIADISSVSGVAEARLEQIAARATQLAYTDYECAGITGEIALSVADRDAILSWANTASFDTIRAACREDPDNAAAAVIAARPFTTTAQIVAANDVGPMTFRSFRDAAIDGPLDALARTVTAANRQVAISTNFNWFTVLFEQPGRPASIACFGIAKSIVDQVYGTVRPTLAGDNEVIAQVTNAVSYANRFGAAIDGTAGLADLSRNVAGQSFFGCYLDFRPDPWSGINRAFYVNTVTGYRVYTETRWSE